ncbi:terminase [Clostridium sp. LP20]|uniref:terminase n=1 Tax=Clostridium sp. LP20 TaxID=3418665 RepID=UPI003EE64D75
MPLELSPKFKDFLTTLTEREYLEGTTAAGKTTVGIFKFGLMVSRSNKKFHVIAGADLGTVEKNVINAELGFLVQFDGIAEYHGNGKGNIKLPHIELQTKNGPKIIYICGYDNKKRWTKVLGSQVGCVYIDEVNIADMEFLREITHRCDYMMTTSNPDDPNLLVYKEFLNRSRPLKKYTNDYPRELLEQLNEEPVTGWVHWYFTFYDNASMTEELIQKKISAVAKGTKMYKNKIQGLRGRATGLVFINFERDKHTKNKEEVKKLIKINSSQEEYFTTFTSGLDTSYSTNSEDTIAMSFLGITNKGNCYLLDEKTYNNKNLNIPIAPSDTVKNYIDFLERNRKEWGFAKNTFIDSADSATITELNKYKREHGSIYNFNPAWKETQIVDRINLQLGWFAHEQFFVLKHCTNYIGELECYSWLEDKDNTPEDKNDHMINSCQYGWLPYKTKIGVVSK